MEDEQDEFIERLACIIEEARAQMTPIQREFSFIRTEEVMERSRNRFWIAYGSGEPGGSLITLERLRELGRFEEAKVAWMLEHGPFSFLSCGAGRVTYALLP